MIFYGWKPLGESRYDRGLFHWVPRIEQVEMFPESPLTRAGTEGIVDTIGSVSAMTETETRDLFATS